MFTHCLFFQVENEVDSFLAVDLLCLCFLVDFRIFTKIYVQRHQMSFSDSIFISIYILLHSFSVSNRVTPSTVYAYLRRF